MQLEKLLTFNRILSISIFDHAEYVASFTNHGNSSYGGQQYQMQTVQ